MSELRNLIYYNLSYSVLGYASFVAVVQYNTSTYEGIRKRLFSHITTRPLHLFITHPLE